MHRRWQWRAVLFARLWPKSTGWRPVLWPVPSRPGCSLTHSAVLALSRLRYMDTLCFRLSYCSNSFLFRSGLWVRESACSSVLYSACSQCHLNLVKFIIKAGYAREETAWPWLLLSLLRGCLTEARCHFQAHCWRRRRGGQWLGVPSFG